MSPATMVRFTLREERPCPIVEASINVQAVLEAYAAAAWAVHDLNRIGKLHTEDTRFHNHIGSPPVVGREAVREALAPMLEQYENFRGEPHRVLYGDNHWVPDWTAHATLAGKDISIDAVDIIVLPDDGLIARKDTYMDAASCSPHSVEDAGTRPLVVVKAKPAHHGAFGELSTAHGSRVVTTRVESDGAGS